MGKLENWARYIITLLIGDTVSKLGSFLVVVGAGLLSGFDLLISAEHVNSATKVADKLSGTYSSGDSLISQGMGAILILVGIFLILRRQMAIHQNPPFLFYVRGMKNMDTNPPLKSLPIKDWAARPLIYTVKSYQKEELLRKYDLMRENFEDRIENPNGSKIYIAALGSFPSLFLFGALLRDAYSNIILMDYNRNKGKWYTLNESCEEKRPVSHLIEGETLNINSAFELLTTDNDTQDVGIALAYTFQIPKEQIPAIVRDHTIILNLSNGLGHNKTDSIETQTTLLNDISVLLNMLSKNSYTVHLFVAAQASFCVALGKNYMNNAHGKVKLYNYDQSLNGYPWLITFDRGTLS